MIYLITYDITLDRIRTKTAKYLIKKGATRLQYSVFAVQKDWREMENMKRYVEQLLLQNNPNHATDSIMVIRINKNSFDNLWSKGLFFEPKLVSGSKNDLIFL